MLFESPIKHPSYTPTKSADVGIAVIIINMISFEGQMVFLMRLMKVIFEDCKVCLYVRSNVLKIAVCDIRRRQV